MVICKQYGSVQLISLIFLMMIFCILMIFTETSVFQLRQYAAAKRQFILLSTAEHKLKEVEKEVVSYSFLNGSAKINDLTISYFSELLGEYNCVIIENKKTIFWKIHVIAENSLREKLHLVSTVAYPIEQLSSCKLEKQVISAGRQSWYQLE